MGLAFKMNYGIDNETVNWRSMIDGQMTSLKTPIPTRFVFFVLNTNSRRLLDANRIRRRNIKGISTEFYSSPGAWHHPTKAPNRVILEACHESFMKLPI